MRTRELRAFRKDVFLIRFTFGDPLFSNGDAVLFAEVIPNGSERSGFEFFEESESLRVVHVQLEIAQSVDRFESGAEERFDRVARSDRPRGDAVDRAVKEVEREIGALDEVVANELFGDRAHLIVPCDDVVGVPANAAADVEKDLVDEHRRGGNLVADTFGRVEMAGVEGQEKIILDGVAHAEFMAADSVAFDADTEELRFDTVANIFLRIFDGEDLVVGFRQALARGETIDGRVLHAVGSPVVDDAGRTELFAEIVRDLATTLVVFDPEIADFLAGMRKSQSVGGLRMREEGRIEIEPDLLSLRPVDPTLEMLGANLVAVDFLAVILKINRVEIESLSSRNERERLLRVGTQFIRRSRFAGIIARRENTARQFSGAFKTGDVVPLPAVKRNLDLINALDSGVNVDSELSISFFR